MTLKAGDALPQVSFMTMTADGPSKVTTDDIFKGKRVVLFAVPGAYTPTCSARHLPGFVDNAETLAGKGVDAIACTSVNDVFVMDAWGKTQNADGKVTMLADGNGEFARAAGLTMDASGFGMGERSQRYALIAKDGVVEQVFIEEPGAFEVSSAEHVLGKL